MYNDAATAIRSLLDAGAKYATVLALTDDQTIVDCVAEANRRDNADSEQQARAHEARWAKQVDARLDQAARLLGVST